MVTPERDLFGNGTPTLRDVGVGEVDSSSYMCASMSGMEITAWEYESVTRHEEMIATGLTDVLGFDIGVHKVTFIV